LGDKTPGARGVHVRPDCVAAVGEKEKSKLEESLTADGIETHQSISPPHPRAPRTPSSPSGTIASPIVCLDTANTDLRMSEVTKERTPMWWQENLLFAEDEI
jgi:hypothetical protein